MTIDVFTKCHSHHCGAMSYLLTIMRPSSKAMKRPPAPLTAPMLLEKHPRVAVNISEDVLGAATELLSPKQLCRAALACRAPRAAAAARRA